MELLDAAETRPLVMIVEPHPLVRELLQDGLEAQGFAWVSAPGGEAALRLLQGLPKGLQGLVTPLRAGRVTGWFLADLVRRSSPSAAVVYTSDANPDLQIDRRIPHGTILVKPFRMDELIERLRRPALAAGEAPA